MHYISSSSTYVTVCLRDRESATGNDVWTLRHATPRHGSTWAQRTEKRQRKANHQNYRSAIKFFFSFFISFFMSLICNHELHIIQPTSLTHDIRRFSPTAFPPKSVGPSRSFRRRLSVSGCSTSWAGQSAAETNYLYYRSS